MKDLQGFLHDKLMSHGLLKFPLGLSSRNRLDANSGRPCWWYGLWMRTKGPHKYPVTTLWLVCEVALISYMHPRQHMLELDPIPDSLMTWMP